MTITDLPGYFLLAASYCLGIFGIFTFMVGGLVLLGRETVRETERYYD